MAQVLLLWANKNEPRQSPALKKSSVGESHTNKCLQGNVVYVIGEKDLDLNTVFVLNIV